MHSFEYRNGVLHCEGVNLDELIDEVGSPAYVYSKATILDHYRRLAKGMSELDCLICYATKANSNLAILNLLAREGSGFDIVSGGELYRVQKSGGETAKCTFAGVGKTRREIEMALDAGILSFNAESEDEVRFIDRVAGEKGVVAPVALRVNPNVDAQTHKYISTGKSENKFGIDFAIIEDAYRRASELKNVRLQGLQMHIGSQLTSVGPFEEAVKKVLPLVESLRDEFGIEFFSIGGGIGIVYNDSLASGETEWWEKREEKPLTLDEYCSTLVPLLKPLGMKIILEPGRFMVGNAGIMITEVLYEKRGSAKSFKIVDAGMNDLIRPALYEGHHDIVPVREMASAAKEKVDIVGPVCESGDFFAQDRELPDVKAGDRIAILSAGAYGFVMASNYNSRPFPPEILVDGDFAHTIRPRQTYEELIEDEVIPN